MTAANKKPLGGKGYGSIPHLPGSRMGPADHMCHDGQRVICCEKTRDRHDRIIVTEKLDGSNVSIANIDGSILAIGRAGYLCETSPFEQHHLFSRWVASHASRFLKVLRPNDRIVGEWMAQAHGTRYVLPHEPFVAFDMFAQRTRLPFDGIVEVCDAINLPTAFVLHDGCSFSIDDAKAAITVSRHGAIGDVEGAVWRVERRGQLDFLAKWVRPDKVDGALLPEFNGTGIPVWNWLPAEQVPA